MLVKPEKNNLERVENERIHSVSWRQLVAFPELLRTLNEVAQLSEIVVLQKSRNVISQLCAQGYDIFAEKILSTLPKVDVDETRDPDNDPMVVVRALAEKSATVRKVLFAVVEMSALARKASIEIGIRSDMPELLLQMKNELFSHYRVPESMREVLKQSFKEAELFPWFLLLSTHEGKRQLNHLSKAEVTAIAEKLRNRNVLSDSAKAHASLLTHLSDSSFRHFFSQDIFNQVMTRYGVSRCLGRTLTEAMRMISPGRLKEKQFIEVSGKRGAARGFKIHVAVSPNDAEYFSILSAIKEYCAQNDILWKVYAPGFDNYNRTMIDKWITIYPVGEDPVYGNLESVLSVAKSIDARLSTYMRGYRSVVQSDVGLTTQGGGDRVSIRYGELRDEKKEPGTHVVSSWEDNRDRPWHENLPSGITARDVFAQASRQGVTLLK